MAALNKFLFFTHVENVRSVSLGRRPCVASQVRLWRHMGFCQINGSLPPPRALPIPHTPVDAKLLFNDIALSSARYMAFVLPLNTF